MKIYHIDEKKEPCAFDLGDGIRDSDKVFVTLCAKCGVEVWFNPIDRRWYHGSRKWKKV